jgi:hypothetical protein
MPLISRAALSWSLQFGPDRRGFGSKYAFRAAALTSLSGPKRVPERHPQSGIVELIECPRTLLDGKPSIFIRQKAGRFSK